MGWDRGIVWREGLVGKGEGEGRELRGLARLSMFNILSKHYLSFWA